MSFVLLSCKGTNEDKTETKAINTEKEIAKTDCGCDELVLTDDEGKTISKGITKNGVKGLFSGNCIEKDMNDSIIKRLEIKNGFISREVNRKKVLDKYVDVLDYKYDYSEGRQVMQNGFEINVDHPIGNSDFYYVKYCRIIKEGQIKEEYKLTTYNDEYNGGKTIISSWQTKNGDYNADMVQPECMPDSKFVQSYGSLESEYKLEGLTDAESDKILLCLKKELKMFNFWLKK